MAVETASMLTYIKHNLILEHPGLFQMNRKRKAEVLEDEIQGPDEEDELIIEEFDEEYKTIIDC